MSSKQDYADFKFWREHNEGQTPAVTYAERLKRAKRDLKAIKDRGLPVRPCSPYGGADLDRNKLHDMLDNVRWVIERSRGEEGF